MGRSLSEIPRYAAITVAVLGIGALAATPALAGGSKRGAVGNQENGDRDGAADHGHTGGGVCKQVAQDTLRSCRNGARDEYWVAVANCDNAASAEPKSARSNDHGAGTCEKGARADLKAHQQDCADQLTARNDVCDQLGGGPYDPKIDPSDFVEAIDNPYLPLTPGTTFHYESQIEAGLELDDIEVTNDTREILGVTCTVVHDVARVDGSITEDTTDWFAQDKTGNVWYFGEDTRQFEDGVLVGIDGAWMAGVDGALPGIVMEAHPAVGDVYRQEFAVGEAEDMAQVVALGQPVTVPYGSFSDALETKEFSALEPGTVENKEYVPDIGFVLSVDPDTGERQELVSITH